MTSNRPALKVLLLLAIISVGFWVASQFPDLVLISIISMLSAFILRPLVVALEFRLGVRRSIAILSIFLVVLGLLAWFIARGVPALIEGVQSMYAGFKAFPFDEKLAETTKKLVVQFPLIEEQALRAKLHEVVQSGLQSLGDGLTAAAAFTLNLTIVPFLTYFILAEGDEVYKKFIQRVPNKYFEMTLNVVYKVERDLVGYLRGWLLDSLIVGVISILGYQVIGLNYAILLGVAMGVSNLIPYVGPIAGIIPAFLVSMVQYGTFDQFLPIALLTLVVQGIDNTFIQPLCFSKTVDMHPVTVIVVCIVGNTLMGVAGMLLAIPVFTILKASATETFWGLKNYQITA